MTSVRRLGWAATLLTAALTLPNAGLAAQPAQCQYFTDQRIQSLEDAQRSDLWQPLRSASIGYTSAQLWIRCLIPAGADYLSADYPAQKLFNVHFTDHRGDIAAIHPSGRIRPASQDPLPTTDFVFPVPDNATEVFLHDPSDGPKYYPLSFLNHAQLLDRVQQISGFHGTFYGIIGLLALASVFMAFVTPNRNFISYAAYLIAMMLFLANMDGFGRLHFWGDWGQMLEYWPTITLVVAAILLSQFCIALFRSKHFMPRHTQLIRALQIGMAINLVLRISTDAYLTILIEPFLMVSLLLLVFAVGIRTAAAGSRNATFFAAGIGALVVAVGIHIATLVGWFELNFFTMYVVHAGTFVETLFQGIALAIVGRQSQSRRIEAQNERMQLSQRVRELQSATRLAEEHRQLQRSLHQAQRQRTLGQMAGGIAHEFNNILASILGFAELSQQQIENRPRVDRYLEEIREAGQRASNLVSQLLLYGRSNNTRRVRSLELNEVLGGTMELLRSSLPPTVKIDLIDHADVTRRPVHMEEQNLQQVLVNLCINASEAMHNRGQITVELGVKDIDDLTCASCGERFAGEYNLIEVRDTGPGVVGNARQLFEPFHTTKEVGSGSGLGLPVVHGIVHDAGGHLRVRNGVDGGCRVSVLLPAEELPLTENNSSKILLIESDPSVARYLESLLDSEDYEVTNTRLATEALESFVAQPEAFDLVITDAVLSHGSGLELAQDLLALRPELPVILTSADEEALDEAEVLQSGVRAVFAKPLETELLIAKIRTLLNTSAAT